MAATMRHMDLVAMRHEATGQEHLFRPLRVPLQIRRGWTVIDDATDPTPEPAVNTDADTQENPDNG